MKCFIANVTLVCFLSWVCQTMVLVISLLMESFATKFTYPWLVAIVYSHVSIQGWASVKCLSTNCALMGLFVCVNYLMPAQGGCLTKTFSTNLTNKRSSSWNKLALSKICTSTFNYFLPPLMNNFSVIKVLLSKYLPVWTGMCLVRL